MHGQALEHFEKEEASEGQGNEQQRVFQRTVAFQVLVHRVDEADAELATEKGLAVVFLEALAQCFFHIGGEETGLPAGGKALGADLALVRQVVADEARVRPVGIEFNLRLTSDRGEAQLTGTLQQQIEGELQAPALVQFSQRKRHMHTSAQQRLALPGWKDKLCSP